MGKRRVGVRGKRVRDVGNDMLPYRYGIPHQKWVNRDTIMMVQGINPMLQKSMQQTQMGFHIQMLHIEGGEHRI